MTENYEVSEYGSNLNLALFNTVHCNKFHIGLLFLKL